MRSFLKVETTLREVKVQRGKETTRIIYPTFRTSGKDIMKKGNKFYAIADERTGMWLTNESEAYDIIDSKLYSYRDEHFKEDGYGIWRDDVGNRVVVETIDCSETKRLKDFKDWLSKLADNHNYKSLDEELTFKSDIVTVDQYRSKRLPYDLIDGPIDNYEAIMSVLYSEKNRDMIEWSIGSILAGWKETKKNDHIVVMYGDPGTGKSTVLDIIKLIFPGYYADFNVNEVVDKSRQFALAAFKDNPLVAIQDDGSLSRIDNENMNKLASHSVIEINEKGMRQYTITPRAICFIASNEVVDLHDSRNGMNRRLLDVYPTGNKISPRTKFMKYKNGIEFEVPAIAKHCLDKYYELGPEYYHGYSPEEMQLKSNYIQNFVMEKSEALIANDPISRSILYKWYKEYCDESGFTYVQSSIRFGEQMRKYYKEFKTRGWIGKASCRNIYSGLKLELVGEESEESSPAELEIAGGSWIIFKEQDSLVDEMLKNCPAQYANNDGFPERKWANNKKLLKDINTRELHYVKAPENHIILDFDLKDGGEKSLEKNLAAASEWPETYAELSKSGAGIHLHYIYNGDATELSRVIGENIEVKVFTGDSSLRRKLTKCNDIPVATLSSGLPLKEKKMVSEHTIKDSKHLRNKIVKALRKDMEVPYTRPCMDYIRMVLDQAYESGISYDLRYMRNAILTFAASSSNNASYCIGLMDKLHLNSDDMEPNIEQYDKDELIFFDVEVFPNVFILCWKAAGPDNPVFRMINPHPEDVEKLGKMRLVGFNNRKYDNHICWLWIHGATNEELYRHSKKIISGESDALIAQAYNWSYTDIYDFSSEKKSLKKFEIELGLTHLENAYPWDEPLPEDKWSEVADYCCNDVVATEAVFNARYGDFLARQMLADVTGMTVNNSTNQLTTRLIFEGNKHPQDEFIYTDLSTEFPGYEYHMGTSTYMDEILGEGGYVWAKHGVYYRVVTMDVASEHPHSIIALNLFGDRYTKRFKDLVDARIAIKRKDLEFLKTVFDGKLYKYVEDGDPKTLKVLSQALKIAINSVYGLTAKRDDNPFRDPRNEDNIVAKRGALFMCKLKNEVISRGGIPVHCKTDSIKLVNPSDELLEFVEDFGRQYGYEFEVEDIYSRFALVNDAVYVAKEADIDIWKATREWKELEWTSTGKQYQEPFVFKSLFSKEPITLEDYAQTKSVSGDAKMYLDFNENDPEGHNYIFVGRVGSFIPVKPGTGGGVLYRYAKNKYGAVTGTKGYRWKETEIVRAIKGEDDIDITYYRKLVDSAIAAIEAYEDFEKFTQ